MQKWILLLVGVVAVSIGVGWAATVAQADPPTPASLTGTMTQVGTKYYIGTTELDFGAQWWIESKTRLDYDGDTSVELIVDELDNLVGTSVTVTGKLAGGGELDVYTLQGMHYRDAGKPPWAGPHGPGGHP